MGKARPAVLLLLTATLALLLAPLVRPVKAWPPAPGEPPGIMLVSASNLVEMHTNIGPGGGPSAPVVLLQGTFTLTGGISTDLLLSARAESALFTNVAGDYSGRYSHPLAGVEVWVEIDGVAVPVASGNAGIVVFNNRDFIIPALLPPAQLSPQHNRTRSVNGFHWLAVNVAPGSHTVVVKAHLETHEWNMSGVAQASFGKRILVVQPTKAAPNPVF